MVVKYDFEENLAPDKLMDLYTGISGKILIGIKDFIKQRWVVLEDEMFAIDGAKVIIILRFKPFRIKLEYFGIKEDLFNKMEQSITKDDWIYFANKINTDHKDLLDFLNTIIQ